MTRRTKIVRVLFEKAHEKENDSTSEMMCLFDKLFELSIDKLKCACICER